jgi:uncharacterized protein
LGIIISKMIPRLLESVIKQRIDYSKAIVVLGPRQVGKTTLLNKIAAELSPACLYLNGDDPAVRLAWNNPTQAFVQNYIGKAKIIFVDEAQRIENFGQSAKMIIDAKQGIQLFISGSSSLDISSKINEPLTGRKWEYGLYPLSWREIKDHFSFSAAILRLEDLLVTGMYPEVITHPENAKETLINLAGSYLYKDILELAGIRRPEILVKLLQALAWQVGQEVSYNELAQTIGADKATVANYLDLLEKAFVVFRLFPFARNLRKEIATSRKIFFYDNGVRNTILNNFASLSERNDVGALWENFLISERKKQLAYNGFYGNSYFWRTVAQSEIDYVEERDGKISIYEFKWSPKAKVRFPGAFLAGYNPITSKVIHRDNFDEWLS